MCEGNIFVYKNNSESLYNNINIDKEIIERVKVSKENAFFCVRGAVAIMSQATDVDI